jgi:hypothetical protein
MVIGLILQGGALRAGSAVVGLCFEPLALSATSCVDAVALRTRGRRLGYPQIASTDAVPALSRLPASGRRVPHGRRLVLCGRAHSASQQYRPGPGAGGRQGCIGYLKSLSAIAVTVTSPGAAAPRTAASDSRSPAWAGRPGPPPRRSRWGARHGHGALGASSLPYTTGWWRTRSIRSDSPGPRGDRCHMSWTSSRSPRATAIPGGGCPGSREPICGTRPVVG